MDILFKREQTNEGIGKVKFKLWSKIELDEEEQALTQKYDFDDAILIAIEQPDLFRHAAIIGILVWLFGTGFFTAMMPMMLSVPVGIAAGIGAAYWWINEKRETIFVKDLIHGRNFKCASVIELAKKEAWLINVVATLRQVMVSAKHWDGTEQFEIKPLPKDEAKEVILRL